MLEKIDRSKLAELALAGGSNTATNTTIINISIKLPAGAPKPQIIKFG